MLHKIKTIRGYKLDSLDGEMGKVKEFYFDDQYWAIRYLVADTGNWLTGRTVLISPHSLVAAIEDDEHLAVNLTKKQIEDSPSLDSDKPVSRQFEESYHGYYGTPMYWDGISAMGGYPLPMIPQAYSADHEEPQGDSHLRSTQEVTGYHIQGTDGEIGHVEDFILDDSNWAIRYLVVDTRNWWPGKKVLIAMPWIQHIDWRESTVTVSLSRDSIQQSPEFNEESLISRDYETRLHGHYERPGYWDAEKPALESVHYY